jgi:hypothetical protein
MPAETPPVAGDLDDDSYPAYTTGRAADILGASPAFRLEDGLGGALRLLEEMRRKPDEQGLDI